MKRLDGNCSITGMIVIATVFSYVWSCSPEINYTPPLNSSDVAITHYSFGKVIVDGKTYEQDIAIFPDKSVHVWQTNPGTSIGIEDIKTALDHEINILIIGIGANKACPLDDEVAEFAQRHGIQVCVVDTYEAVNLFNIWPKHGLCVFLHLRE